MTKNPRQREYELKFKARPEDLERFMAAVAQTGTAGAQWTRAELSNSYFDTPDHRLRQMGVSVRLRRTKGKCLQTVKANTRANGGLMDRDEWEMLVVDDTLDFSVLPAAAKRALRGVRRRDLKPVLEVKTERHTMIVRRNSPLGPELAVEAAADRAVVRAGGAVEHFCECELELMEGDITGFFTLAAEIHDRCPLAMSAITKAGRGYRLLTGEPQTAGRIANFDLHADETVHDALASIFTTCIGNIVVNEEVCLAAIDPEGVHQMRVSTRRLRSALKIFGPYLRPAKVAWMDDDLKWLGGTLGPACDWDVFIDETLASMAGQGIDAATIQALRKRAEAERKRAYVQVRKTLGGERYAKLVFRLTAFIALDGWLAGPFDASDPLLQRLDATADDILRRPYRKLIKAGKNLADQDLESRHVLRIRLKKLRYAVDFLRRVYPDKKTRPFMAALRELQDLFGRVNDLAQAERLTGQLTEAGNGGTVGSIVHLAAGQVRGWHARALHEIEPVLIASWERFVATPPFWATKD